MSGLKDCPFCGSGAIINTFVTAAERVQRFRVKCLKCWCETDWDNFSEDEAKQKWNTRSGNARTDT